MCWAKPLMFIIAPERSFSELLNLHKELEEAFHRHQHALLRLDFTEAARLLLDFEALLVAHMTDEEETLIPIYAERVAAGRSGTVEFFLGEHRKMLTLIADFMRQLAGLPTSTDVERDVIALFDDEATFKYLVERHDAREEKILYPALDRVTTEEEKRLLLEKVHGVSSRCFLGNAFITTAHQ
jgi:regulator of cell morphogenesis and NO signaling